jgi:hypothetical protein
MPRSAFMVAAARGMTELETIEHQHAIRLARWSAALGTLGLVTAVFGIGVLLAMAAIACAVLALNHLASLRSQDAHGIALIGLAAGILALLVFPLLMATAVPHFIDVREKTNHEICYGNLFAIDELMQAEHRSVRTGVRLAPVEGAELDPAVAEMKCPSGGKYRVKERKPARCSIPLHNEPPGRMEPPRRLRFSSRPGPTAS